MKLKKLPILFLSLLVISVSFLASLFISNTSYALDGTFRWDGPGRIIAEGYSTSGPINFNGAMPQFQNEQIITKKFIDVENPTSLICQFTATISVNPGNPGQGTITALDKGNPIGSFCFKEQISGDIVIANPEKGPAAGPGGGVDYPTANCADGNANGGDQAKCESIKKCVNVAKKAQADCVASYDTCINNHTNGTISDDDRKKCQGLVGDGKLDEAGKIEGKKSDCAIQGVGWLVCPVAYFLANVADGAYKFIESFLVVPPLYTPGQGSTDNGSQAIYTAWSNMRNIANVAFVIVFLIVIVSQVTTIGLSNYGIKKLLPKLIIIAILVNSSYWISAIAVDLSNIIGSSLYGLIQGTAAQNLFVPPDSKNFGATGDGLLGIAGGILAGTIATGALLYVGISALLPVLVSVVFAVIIVFIVLIIRQAVIILLIVISPLIFVSLLLPNTEGLGKKGFKMAQAALLMYPILALVFGACALASKVLMVGATGDLEIPIKLGAVFLQIVPVAFLIFGLPALLGAMSNVLGRFVGKLNNPNKGPVDSLRKKASGYRDRRQNIMRARRLQGTNMFNETGKRIRGDGSSRFRNAVGGGLSGASKPGGAFASWRAQSNLKTEQKNANAEKALSQTKQEYTAQRIASEMAASPTNSSKYAQAIAGPTGDVAKIQAAAIAAQRAEIIEAVKNAQTTMRAEVPPGDIAAIGRRLADAIRENDSVKAQAAQNLLMTSGGKGLSEYRDTMTKVGQTDPGLMANQASTDMRRNMLENHSGVKASAADFISQASTGKTMGEASHDPGTWKLADAEMVRQKEPSIELAITSGGLAPEQAKRIISNEELAQHLSSPEIRAKVKAVADRATTPNPNP